MQITLLRPARPARLAGIGAALVLTVGLAACSSDAEDTAETTTYDTSVRDAAAGWATTQVDGGLAHNREFDIDDYSLSTDIAIGLVASGSDEQATAEEIVAALQENQQAYLAPGFGTQFSTGSAAKLAVAVEAVGEDASDLIDQVEAHTEDGRIADQLDPKDKKAADYANMVGQSYALRATGSDEMAAFMVDQQCEDGGFPITFVADGGNCTADPDATAYAVAALADLDEHDDATHEALTAGTRWLLDAQAEDGSFATAQAPVGNANTTGVAGAALDAAGEGDAAEQAAIWVAEHVVPCGEEAGGAIAYDDTALTQVGEQGITAKTEGQFRLATAQALPVLTHLPEDAVPAGFQDC